MQPGRECYRSHSLHCQSVFTDPVGECGTLPFHDSVIIVLPQAPCGALEQSIALLIRLKQTLQIGLDQSS